MKYRNGREARIGDPVVGIVEGKALVGEVMDIEYPVGATLIDIVLPGSTIGYPVPADKLIHAEDAMKAAHLVAKARGGIPDTAPLPRAGQSFASLSGSEPPKVSFPSMRSGRVLVASSNIAAVGYVEKGFSAELDQATGTLEVEFRNGSVYSYEFVPKSLHEMFMLSESKGKFLAEAIKPHFTGVKIA